jgi:hypothetical protein
LPSSAVALGVAASAYAFTSNTVCRRQHGIGFFTISGYTVSSVAYTLNHRIRRRSPR